jgi:hypothetical protein
MIILFTLKFLLNFGITCFLIGIVIVVLIVALAG